MGRQGLLLVNLGSPDAPREPDVRRYLSEFFMDEHVLGVPQVPRWFMVHCAIVPSLVAETTRAYQSIWSPKGSPAVVAGRSLAEKLEAALGMPVALAMRYRRPTVSLAVRRLYTAGVRKLNVLPLFPQYSPSGYESAVAHVDREIQTLVPGMRHEFIPPFFEEPEYLDALAVSAAPFLGHGFDHLLFSFRGLAERQLRYADPTGGHCMGSESCCEILSPARRTCYRTQCLATAQAAAQRLELEPDQWSVSFQSLIIRDSGMQPLTDDALRHLAAAGIKRLLVICPAFIADGLETLHEIGIRGAELFRAAGGGELTLIPCLNDHPAWVEALCAIVSRYMESAVGAHSPAGP